MRFRSCPDCRGQGKLVVTVTCPGCKGEGNITDRQVIGLLGDLVSPEIRDWIARVIATEAPHCRYHLEFRSDCPQCVSEREFR